MENDVLALEQSGDVLFMMLGAAMVFAMHGGFAFLEVGTVRKKNQVNALVHVLRRIGRTGLLAFLLAAGTSACASNQTADGFETVWDPIEGFNRTIFQINQGIDFILIRPVSATYRQVVPDPLQEIVTNVLRHLRTPVILINELLQGDWEGAEVAATRFFLNTIVGVAGIADVAAYVDPDLAFQAEDFGQTLAVWGVGDGPYLVLPILGPSNLRDTGGLVVDIATEYVLFPDSDPAGRPANWSKAVFATK